MFLMLPMLTISSRSWVWTLAAPTLALTVYSLIEYFSMTFNRCVIHKNLLLGFQNYTTALKLLVTECHNWFDHARPVMHVFPCNDVQIYARACIFFSIIMSCNSYICIIRNHGISDRNMLIENELDNKLKMGAWSRRHFSMVSILTQYSSLCVNVNSIWQLWFVIFWFVL